MGSLSSTPHYPTSDSFLDRCLAAWSDGPRAPPCSALHSVVRSQGGDGEGKAGGYSRTFVEPVFSADGCQASTQPSPSLCAMPAAPAPKNTKRLALAPCPVLRLAGWQGEGVQMLLWESLAGRGLPLLLPSTSGWHYLQHDLRKAGKAGSHLGLHPMPLS